MRNRIESPDTGSPAELEAAGNGKSRKMRAGFATLAVLGLGAGITLAAWTGNVPFTGTVTAGPGDRVELLGAVSNSETVPGGAADWSASVDLGNVDVGPDQDPQDSTRYVFVKAPDGLPLSAVDDNLSWTDAVSATVEVGDWSAADGTGQIWSATLKIKAVENIVAVHQAPLTFTATGTVGTPATGD